MYLDYDLASQFEVTNRTQACREYCRVHCQMDLLVKLLESDRLEDAPGVVGRLRPRAVVVSVEILQLPDHATLNHLVHPTVAASVQNILSTSRYASSYFSYLFFQQSNLVALDPDDEAVAEPDGSPKAAAAVRLSLFPQEFAVTPASLLEHCAFDTT